MTSFSEGGGGVYNNLLTDTDKALNLPTEV